MYDMLATPLLHIYLSHMSRPQLGPGLRSEFSPTDLTLFACPSAESPSVPQCPPVSPALPSNRQDFFHCKVFNNPLAWP